MMNAARSFKEFFEASFNNEVKQEEAKNLINDFMSDFVVYTPLKLDLLESYLVAGQYDNFYKSLADLKYLIEFSDNFSRYWHVLRGYSGAMAKLKADPTVKASKKLYSYYFEKYGDRRMLRNEHWFEKMRWDFLDTLQSIYTEIELLSFIKNYQQVLNKNFRIYQSFLTVFINELRSFEFKPVVPEYNK